MGYINGCHDNHGDIMGHLIDYGQCKFSSRMFRLLHFVRGFPMHVWLPKCIGFWWVSMDDFSVFCWWVSVLAPEQWGNITKNHQHLHLLPPQMPTANLKHHQQKHAYAKSIGGKHMNKSPTKRICLQTPTTQELTLRIGLLARFLFSYQVYVAIPNQDFLFFKESF